MDDDVDAAELALGRVEQRVGAGGPGEVGADRDRAAAGVGDGGDDRDGRLGVAGVGDDDGLAVGGEALRDGAADAAGGAGDDRDAGGRLR